MDKEDFSPSEIREQVEKYFEGRAVQLRTQIASELLPFINGIYSLGTSSRNFTLFQEAYLYFKNKYEEKQGMLKSIMKPAIEQNSTGVKNALYLLFLYLGAVESVGNSLVDMLVMLLVAKGRDFHIECRGYRTPRIRHVLSLEKDLEKERIPLGTKLSFIRENGLETIASIIDSELRNTIAHLKFDIKEEGIYIKGERAEVVVLFGLRELFVVIDIVGSVLNKIAEDRGIIPKERKKQ